MKFNDIAIEKACDRALEKLIGFILRFNKFIILVVLLITVGCAFWLPKISVGSAVEVLYPAKGDPERNFLERTYKIFGTDWFQTIAITSPDLFSYSTLKKVQKLTSEIEKKSTVDHVVSLTNVAIIKEDRFGGILVQDLASEYKDFDILGASYLKVGKDAMAITRESRNVPKAKRELEQFKNYIIGNPLYANNLVSPDLNTTIINVYFKDNISDKALIEIEREIRKLAFDSAGPEEINIISPGAIGPIIFEMIAKDLSIYLPLTIIIIIVILLLSFRNGKVVSLFFITITVPIIWILSLMAALKIPIFILTAAIPPIIAAQGLAYCIHFFSEFSAQSSFSDDRHHVMRQTLRKALPGIFLSALTTSIGFVSIAPVNVVAIKQMGILLSIGIIILFLVVCFFTPSMLIYIYPKARHHLASFNTPRYCRYDGVPLFCFRHRVSIFIITALLSIMSVYGFSKLVVETDVNQLFRSSSSFRRAVDMVAEIFKGTTPINIIIEAQERYDLSDPAILESMEKLQAILDKQPVVAKSISVVDYLKLMNRTFHKNNLAYNIIPNSKDKIEQYLRLYSLEDTSGSLNHFIDKGRKTANISLRSSLTNTADILKFKQFIEDECARVLPANISWKVTSFSILMATVAQKLSHGIIYGFTQAVLVIFLLMALLSRSVKVGLAAMVPNITPLVFVLGFMGFAHIDFNVGTSIVVCIAIGIAVDDTIHFLARYFQELRKTDDQQKAIVDTFRHERGPITLIGVSVILGFVVLTFSQFVPMALFGALTALALFVGIICELIILPALLVSIKIRNKAKEV